MNSLQDHLQQQQQQQGRFSAFRPSDRFQQQAGGEASGGQKLRVASPAADPSGHSQHATAAAGSFSTSSLVGMPAGPHASAPPPIPPPAPPAVFKGIPPAPTAKSVLPPPHPQPPLHLSYSSAYPRHPPRQHQHAPPHVSSTTQSPQPHTVTRQQPHVHHITGGQPLQPPTATTGSAAATRTRTPPPQQAAKQTTVYSHAQSNVQQQHVNSRVPMGRMKTTGTGRVDPQGMTFSSPPVQGLGLGGMSPVVGVVGDSTAAPGVGVGARTPVPLPAGQMSPPSGMPGSNLSFGGSQRHAGAPVLVRSSSLNPPASTTATVTVQPGPTGPGGGPGSATPMSPPVHWHAGSWGGHPSHWKSQHFLHPAALPPSAEKKPMQAGAPFHLHRSSGAPLSPTSSSRRMMAPPPEEGTGGMAGAPPLASFIDNVPALDPLNDSSFVTRLRPPSNAQVAGVGGEYGGYLPPHVSSAVYPSREPLPLSPRGTGRLMPGSGPGGLSLSLSTQQQRTPVSSQKKEVPQSASVRRKGGPGVSSSGAPKPPRGSGKPPLPPGSFFGPSTGTGGAHVEDEGAVAAAPVVRERTEKERERAAAAAAAREAAVQARFDALFNDSRFRQMRRERDQARVRESEEQELGPRRKFLSNQRIDSRQWNDRYQQMLVHRSEVRKEHELIRAELERRKTSEEMKECTFKPKISQSPLQKKTEVARRQLQQLALSMAENQERLLDTLFHTEEEEQRVRMGISKECDEELERALSENRKVVETFLASDEGQRVLDERTVAYSEYNPGISRERAREEAERDIFESNEEQLRVRVRRGYEDRDAACRNKSRVLCMSVLEELQSLENEFLTLCNNAGIAPEVGSGSGFDFVLSQKLKREPWYTAAAYAGAGAGGEDGEGGDGKGEGAKGEGVAVLRALAGSGHPVGAAVPSPPLGADRRAGALLQSPGAPRGPSVVAPQAVRSREARRGGGESVGRSTGIPRAGGRRTPVAAGGVKRASIAMEKSRPAPPNSAAASAPVPAAPQDKERSRRQSLKAPHTSAQQQQHTQQIQRESQRAAQGGPGGVLGGREKGRQTTPGLQSQKAVGGVNGFRPYRPLAPPRADGGTSGASQPVGGKTSSGGLVGVGGMRGMAVGGSAGGWMRREADHGGIMGKGTDGGGDFEVGGPVDADRVGPDHGALVSSSLPVPVSVSVSPACPLPLPQAAAVLRESPVSSDAEEGGGKESREEEEEEESPSTSPNQKIRGEIEGGDNAEEEEEGDNTDREQCPDHHNELEEEEEVGGEEDLHCISSPSPLDAGADSHSSPSPSPSPVPPLPLHFGGQEEEVEEQEEREEASGLPPRVSPHTAPFTSFANNELGGLAVSADSHADSHETPSPSPPHPPAALRSPSHPPAATAFHQQQHQQQRQSVVGSASYFLPFHLHHHHQQQQQVHPGGPYAMQQRQQQFAGAQAAAGSFVQGPPGAPAARVAMQQPRGFPSHPTHQQQTQAQAVPVKMNLRNVQQQQQGMQGTFT